MQLLIYGIWNLNPYFNAKGSARARTTRCFSPAKGAGRRFRWTAYHSTLFRALRLLIDLKSIMDYTSNLAKQQQWKCCERKIEFDASTRRNVVTI